LHESALQLYNRFQQSGDSAAINDAVQLFGEAVNLTPDGHACKGFLLGDLGVALQDRFHCLGELGDMEKAISFQRQAVDLTLDDHTDKAGRLSELGMTFWY
jgi:hypothetical protein